MFGLGTPELLLIFVVVVLVFGAGKLPEIGSGLGKAIRNFKKAGEEINMPSEENVKHSPEDKTSAK